MPDFNVPTDLILAVIGLVILGTGFGLGRVRRKRTTYTPPPPPHHLASINVNAGPHEHLFDTTWGGSRNWHCSICGEAGPYVPGAKV